MSLLLALLLAVLCIHGEAAALPVAAPRVMNITVMSYNLRCSLCDFDYPWSKRVEAFRDIFARYQVPSVLESMLSFLLLVVSAS
jgi:hypothetical protein